MRVDLDAKLVTSDGHAIGTIERAVVDPATNEVADFVINTGGLFGRDLLMPRAEIERAAPDGDALRLRLTKAQLDDLPAFMSANYVPPPAGWALAGDYPFGVGGYLWPAAAPIPGAYADAGAAAGTYAATGGVGVGDPTLAKGDVVIDRDGDEVGVVDDVIFDASTGRLTGFVLRVGNAFVTLFGGGDTVQIGRNYLDRVEEARVYLNAPKDALTPTR
jgi:sporulation protein YlmC with PRC-barrel domain